MIKNSGVTVKESSSLTDSVQGNQPKPHQLEFELIVDCDRVNRHAEGVFEDSL